MDCVRSEVVLRAADSGLIWSHWRTSKSNRASAWAATDAHRRPRMTEELKEIGLKVGDRRVGRFLLIVASNDCQAVDAPERYICCPNREYPKLCV